VITAVICAVIALTAALLAAFMLRRVEPAAHHN
jgi:MFS transporter, DHA2 family, multidrug resistance protein